MIQYLRSVFGVSDRTPSKVDPFWVRLSEAKSLPRELTPLARRRCIYGNAIGPLLLLFITIVLHVLSGAIAGFVESVEFSGGGREAQGRVVTLSETTWRRNGQRMPIATVAYTVDGGRYEVTSYVDRRVRAGSSITVEYPPGHPERGRVRAAHRSRGSDVALIVPMVFLVLFFLFLVFVIYEGRKVVFRLREFRVVPAEITLREWQKTKNGGYYNVSYRFKNGDIEHRIEDEFVGKDDVLPPVGGLSVAWYDSELPTDADLIDRPDRPLPGLCLLDDGRIDGDDQARGRLHAVAALLCVLVATAVFGVVDAAYLGWVSP